MGKFKNLKANLMMQMGKTNKIKQETALRKTSSQERQNGMTTQQVSRQWILVTEVGKLQIWDKRQILILEIRLELNHHDLKISLNRQPSNNTMIKKIQIHILYNKENLCQKNQNEKTKFNRNIHTT